MNKTFYFIVQNEEDFNTIKYISNYDIMNRLRQSCDCLDGFPSTFGFYGDFDYQTFSRHFGQVAVSFLTVDNSGYIVDFSTVVRRYSSVVNLFKEEIKPDMESFFLVDESIYQLWMQYNTLENINNMYFNNTLDTIKDFIGYNYTYYDKELSKLRRLLLVLNNKFNSYQLLDEFDKLVGSYLPTLTKLAKINSTRAISDKEKELVALSLNYIKTKLYPKVIAQLEVNNAVISSLESKYIYQSGIS